MTLAPVLTLITGLWAFSFAQASSVGEVFLHSDSFVSPDYQATSDKGLGFVGVQWSTLSGNPFTRTVEPGFQGHIKGEVSPQLSMMNYVDVSELFYQSGGFAFGRKREGWSFLDETWHLGLFEPQLRWNPLLPSSQGLSGVFWDFRSGEEQPWGARFFASFLYMPDQGAGFDVRNGQFESANPWFHAPPAQAQFTTTGAIDQVAYDVHRPDVREVLFRPSYVAEGYLGKVEEGLFLQAATGYKPSNQLALGVDGVVTPNDQVSAQILPTVYNHTLVSADARYSFSQAAMGIGGIAENPTAPNVPQDYTYATYDRSQLLSPYIMAKGKIWEGTISYLSVTGGDSQISGPKAKEMGALLPKRYPFQSAYKADLQFHYNWRKWEGLSVNMGYTQGTQDEFEMITTRLAYQWDRHWAAQGLVLLVRADAATATVYRDYENNDLVQLGVSYVF